MAGSVSGLEPVKFISVGLHEVESVFRWYKRSKATNDAAVAIRHELGGTQQPLAAYTQCDGENCEYVVMTLKIQCFLSLKIIMTKAS